MTYGLPNKARQVNLPIAEQYARDVISGSIVASKLVVAAAQRHLSDRSMVGVASDYYFDENAAQRVIDFFQFLRHSKGEWSGKVLELAPWQQFIVWCLFGWKKKSDGMRRFREAYIEVARKNGKALEVTTPVPTPSGWVNHGDLKAGDFVIGIDGNPKKVLAVTEHYEGNCHTVRTCDGAVIVAHDNHEWVTRRNSFTKRARGSRKPLPTVTTLELRDTLRAIGSARKDFVHRIAVTGSLQLPTAALSVAPYVLGAWLGDGHSACARITTADTEVLDAFSLYGVDNTFIHNKDNGLASTYSIGRGWLQKELRHIGVLNNKHIPLQYLRASHEQRLELLCGLMDTDGSVSARGQHEFVSVNETLAVDVMELCRTLGLKPTITIDEAKLNGVVISPRYRIQIWPHNGQPICNLARKADRQSKVSDKVRRSNGRTVVAVEPAGIHTVNCIQVEGGMYLAGEHFVPTHNSTLLAGIGLFMLFGDGEGGAEVYTAATTQKQAKIVFDEAANMRDSSPLLKQAIVKHRNNLHVLSTKSKFEPLSNESETLDGLNVHAALVDELHEHKNRALWDVLDTATGARRQSLMFAITTAGFDRESFCWKQREHSEKILNGILRDDHFFCFVACLDGARTVDGVDIPADDWEDEHNWPKANPNLGVSVKLEDLQRKAKRAKEDPASQNNFLRKHLNVWTRNDTRWMPMDKWRECHGITDTKLSETGAVILISPREARDKYAVLLKGRPAFGGLDLSTTTDLTAFVLLFPPWGDDKLWRVLPYFWIPEDNMHERVKRDRVPYDVWEREGFIEATDGVVIDYEFVRLQINKAAKDYRIKEVAFDRANSSMLVTLLKDADGMTMVDYGQGTLSMSAPTKQVLTMVLQKTLAHLNNPVLTWMADNTVVTMNAAGDVKPDKSKARERMDGIVALVMALGRGILQTPKPFVYATRGITIL